MPIQLKSPLKPEEIPVLTPADVDAAATAIPPYPGGFKGRGITVCAGGFIYFTNAWILMRMLRMLGCKLPIQFWYDGEEELDSRMRKLVEPYGVECVDAREVARRMRRRISRGWPLKPLSILYSPFQEVLALDADNIPVRNPEYLFECDGYRETGAMFWPDQGRTGPTRPIWDLMKVAYRDEPEFETGQVVVNKELCWEPLNLAMWMNEEGRADFIYKIIWGDKDTFRFAWHKFGFPFAMTRTPLQMLSVAGGPCCIGVMCQHDLDDERIFQHRNMFKWHLFGTNPWVPGFLFEGECRGFLAELKTKWNGRIGMPKPKPQGRGGRAADELTTKVWLLDAREKRSRNTPRSDSPDRAATEPAEKTANDGKDKAKPRPTDPWPPAVQKNFRELRFLENGTFGFWSDPFLTFWSLQEGKKGELTLLCAGSDGANAPTARFRQKPDGTWIGRSLESTGGYALRLRPVETVYLSAEGGGAPERRPRRIRPAANGGKGVPRKLHVFNSAYGIGDHIVSLYACVGAVRAGMEIVFHTRFPQWLERAQHPGLTITGELPPGLPAPSSNGGSPQPNLPKGVIDLNHDPIFQVRFGTNRALWYADAVRPGLKPGLPRKIDRRIRVPRFDFDRYVVLAPFSAWVRRDWPAPNWTRLTHLLRQAGFEVVAIGTSSDAKRFEEAFTQTTAMWAIDHSPEWVMDAMLGATCVIGNDSGMSHLAGLLGVPTLAIHAHLTGDFLFLPAEVTSITPKTTCAFCRWQPENGYNSACDAACSALSTVGPEDVMKAFRKLPPSGGIEARSRIASARRRLSRPLQFEPDTARAENESAPVTEGTNGANARMANGHSASPQTAQVLRTKTSHRGMIAVTIGVGSTWRTVAELAAERCRKMTGLRTAIMDDETMSRHSLRKPHHLKFRLFDEFPDADTILYFDADTIFLRPWDVRGHRHTADFVCVPDLARENVVISEARSIGIPAETYFNSGLFIASRSIHERMFHLAEDMSGQFFSTFHDQTYLNSARDRLGLHATYLDRRFNHLRLERASSLEEVIVGHFRWIDSKPREMLADYFAHWDQMIAQLQNTRGVSAEPLLKDRYNFRRGGGNFESITFNADKSLNIDGTRREWFWEISMEGRNRVLWICDDNDTLFWARELIGGGWQGQSMKFEPVEFRPIAERRSSRRKAFAPDARTVINRPPFPRPNPLRASPPIAEKVDAPMLRTR